ncbi:excinuclease Cho [Xanthomonas arboricola]
MPSSAKRARRASDVFDYAYPEHLRDCVEARPKAAGVYTFHGKEGLLPLYIGKSINVRTRVMDHCRTPEEASLLRQTTSVSCISMAGDVGARLLEAQMVKRQMPLYNKLLRKVPRQFSIRLYRGEVSIVHSAEYDVTSSPMLYGLYSSPQSAQKSLRRIADDHRLCYSLVGLERLPLGRPCFRAMLKRCAGACSGGETLDEHEERLRAALIRLELSTWPFHGRIALEEKGQNLRQLHVLDAWHYLGTVTTLTAARKLKGEPLDFDRDSYRIIRAAIESGLHAITVLGP